MIETLDYTIRVGSTPTFLYFDLYLYSAYAAHYVYFNKGDNNKRSLFALRCRLVKTVQATEHDRKSLKGIINMFFYQKDTY